MNRSKVALVVSLLLIAAIGSMVTGAKVDEGNDLLKEQVMSQARLTMYGINASHVMALSGTEADLGTPGYERLKQQLMHYREDMTGVRFIYLVGKLSNGTPFFYVDSEPVNSSDYSPPGELYTDQPEVFDRSFEGEQFLEGPSKDRWGEYYTAMIPVTDPDSGMVVAVLGVDIGSQVWDSKVITGGLPYALTTLLFGALIVAFYVIEQRGREERRRQALSAKQLKQSNDKLSILNNITRHDIMNQVTVLNGYLTLTKDKAKDPAVSAYVDKMVQAVVNIQQQIDFGKDYQEIGLKTPVWSDIRDQMRRAFSLLNPPGIVLEDGTEGIQILADPMVGKVYYNLLHNTIRHGGTVHRVRVSAEEKDGALMIVYEDDGVGISDENRPRLFLEKEERGRGLGLLLIRDILAITGITIEERGLGDGARFVITVPPGAWRRTLSSELHGEHGED